MNTWVRLIFCLNDMHLGFMVSFRRSEATERSYKISQIRSKWHSEGFRTTGCRGMSTPLSFFSLSSLKINCISATPWRILWPIAGITHIEYSPVVKTSHSAARPQNPDIVFYWILWSSRRMTITASRDYSSYTPLHCHFEGASATEKSSAIFL